MGRAVKPLQLRELARQGNVRPSTVLALADGRRVEVAWPSWPHGLDAKATDSAMVRELVEEFTGTVRGDVFWLRPEAVVVDWTPPDVHTPAAAAVDVRAFADVDPLRAGGQRGALL